MAKAAKGKQTWVQQRKKANAERKRKRENQRNRRACLKDHQRDSIREKDTRARSKSRERKSNTPEERAKQLVEQKKNAQHHASKRAAAKAAADEKCPELNYVPVQLFGTEKREVSAPGKSQTSLTPSKRDAVNDLAGNLGKYLKVTEVPWSLTPMTGRSIDATSRHAIQVSFNPVNALGLDNYEFVEKTPLHKEHFDLQYWEFQEKQPIGSDCPITCPAALSEKTGPALVGVINGSSFNNIMLRKYPRKGNGDCIAIYPLPKNRTFIRGSILEFKIVSSTYRLNGLVKTRGDKIVVVHLGRPRALPTIENWDFLPRASRTFIRGEVYNDPRFQDGSKVMFCTARPIRNPQTVKYLTREICPVADPEVTSGSIVVVEGYMGYRLGRGLELNDWGVSGRADPWRKVYKHVGPPPSHRWVVNIKAP